MTSIRFKKKKVCLFLRNILKRASQGKSKIEKPVFFKEDGLEIFRMQVYALLGFTPHLV